SLGGTSTSPDDPAAVACDNATLAGVTVVVAAGNAGTPTAANPTGEGTLGSPATGRRVITVGASNDPGAGANTVDDLGPGGRAGMYAYLFDGSAPVASSLTNNYVYCGLGDTPDQFPASVAGKIALVRRGGTAEAGGQSTGLVSNKAALATAAGAVALIVFNNVDGEISAVTARKTVIPTVGISKANGEYLLAQLGSAEPGAVSPNRVRINANDFQPMMAGFTSKGPVGDYGQVKPDVVAPGVDILSATVRAGAVRVAYAVSVPPGVGYGYMFDPLGYTSASGTSFASPITAGVAALIKQKHPTWTPAMIRAALVNTATNLRGADGTPVADGTQSLNEQGGGLIDAGAAADAKALMGAGAPGPVTGGAPMARAFAVGVGPLTGRTPGNPDFSPSYSFANVPVAGVEGAAALTQTVNIYDVSGGGGAGVYELSASGVRAVDGTGVQLKITDAAGRAVSSVEVPAGKSASFNVTALVGGASVADGTQIQWYVTAVRSGGGQRLRMPFYARAVRPTVAAAAPTLGDVAGNEVADAPPVDIDGAYRLTFAKPSAGATPSKLRVEESADGGATWATLADVDAAQTSYDVSGRANGTRLYRAVALYPVEYGLLAGPASAEKSVRVERRVEQDVTALVQAAIVDGSVNFSGGVAEFDQTLRNASASALYAPLRFVVTSVQSNSGRVRVSNADDGGTGAAGSPAAFDYSAGFGPDFAPNELSAAKRLRFANPASELFQFTAVVYAHVPDPAYAQAGSTSQTGASGDSSSSTGGTAAPPTAGTLGTLPLTQTKALTFRVNPLTKTVSLLK
ncbi:MAG TPA: S8 family serine peptidase, partial [Pyrinomonadaceae bacterium]